MNKQDLLNKIKKMNYNKEDLFVVLQCYVDMLANNLDYKDDNIGEYFYDWCEGGEVFYNMYGNWATEHLTEKQNIEAKTRCEIMEIICEVANEMSDLLLLLYNNADINKE